VRGALVSSLPFPFVYCHRQCRFWFARVPASSLLGCAYPYIESACGFELLTFSSTAPQRTLLAVSASRHTCPVLHIRVRAQASKRSRLGCTDALPRRVPGSFLNSLFMSGSGASATAKFQLMSVGTEVIRSELSHACAKIELRGVGAGSSVDVPRYLVRVSAGSWNGALGLVLPVLTREQENVFDLLDFASACVQVRAVNRLRFSRGEGAQLSYTLSANVQPVVGECNSYRDCMPVHSSVHPTKGTGRDSDSANGD
jgi:hypothetical protein